ncbi:hypothetical protein BGZ97_009997, partial [Linnemannia gamsii]
NTEILAIKTAFPSTPILYCAWHVLKAWERGIRQDLHAILYEKDKAVAMSLLAQFRVRWKKQENLLEYFNKNYFGEDLLANHNDDDQEDNDDDDDVLEDEDATSATSDHRHQLPDTSSATK